MSKLRASHRTSFSSSSSSFPSSSSSSSFKKSAAASTRQQLCPGKRVERAAGDTSWIIENKRELAFTIVFSLVDIAVIYSVLYFAVRRKPPTFKLSLPYAFYSVRLGTCSIGYDLIALGSDVEENA